MQTITRCFVIDGVEMVEKWRWVGRVLTPDQKETITISGIIEPSTNVNTVDPSNINVIGRLQSTPSAKILFSVLFIYTRLSTFIGRDNLDVFIRYFFSCLHQILLSEESGNSLLFLSIFPCCFLIQIPVLTGYASPQHPIGRVDTWNDFLWQITILRNFSTIITGIIQS